MVFKGLSKNGISSKDISRVVQKANRKMNERLGNDLKQAYKDYKQKKISGEEFKSRLYEAATKKVQGIAFALKSVYSQKPASGANANGSMTPSFAKKADANGSMTPSFAKKADNNGSTTPSFAKKADDNGSALSFAKKDDAKTAPAPRTSIFDKKEDAKPAPTVTKDEPTLAEKAMAANKEKKAEAKAAAKADEKTAMEAKPTTATKTEAIEKAIDKLGNAQEKADATLAEAQEKADKVLAKAAGDPDKAVKAQEKAASILAEAEDGVLPIN